MGKKLTLHALVRNSERIYVRNNLNPRGILFFAVEGHNIRIPDTNLPWPVDIPGEQLTGSYDFNQALLRGAIVLVDPDDAAEELDTPRALREIRRLTRSKFAGPLVQHIDALKAESAKEKGLMDEGPKQPLPEESKLIPKIDQNVYPRVIGIIQQLNTGDITVSDARDELEAVEDLLAAPSYRYIIAKAETQTIQEWAKRKLAPMDESRKKRVKRSKKTDEPAKRAKKPVRKKKKDE